MAATFLSSRPRGAYTCVRFDSTGRLLERDVHVNRICDSVCTIFGDSIPKDKDAFVEGLRKTAIDKFDKFDKFHGNVGMMLVMLVYLESGVTIWEENAFPIPVKRTTIEKVVLGVGGVSRRNPVAKDTAWIDERKPLEDMKKATKADEVLLVEQNQAGEIILLEGLVTNLFVLLNDDQTLVTAPSDLVLPGSMRKTVMTAALATNFKVLERAPVWSERTSWRAAFLTSVAKPCCFIHTLQRFEQDEDQPAESQVLQINNAAIERLCNAVDAYIDVTYV